MCVLLYCLHAPHFPAASMHQFYRRAETKRAKRVDDVGRSEGRGADEDGAERLCGYRVQVESVSAGRPERDMRMAKVKLVAWG